MPPGWKAKRHNVQVITHHDHDESSSRKHPFGNQATANG
jgi:hypothetical protein